MPKVIRFYETGSADVLKVEDAPTAEPGKGEVRLKVTAIGLNRAEVMFREGQYLETPVPPSRIGYEASGIVEAVGPDNSTLKVGDKVSTIPAFSMGQYGVYAENPVVPSGYSHELMYTSASRPILTNFPPELLPSTRALQCSQAQNN